MTERRKVDGFEGYSVDRLGNVYRDKKSQGTKTGKLNPYVKKDTGYAVVNLRDRGRTKTMHVHILVLTAFDRPKKGKEQCRHLNGIRTDNRIENLRWGSRKENMRDMVRHGRSQRGEKCKSAKLTEEDVLHIRRSVAAGERQDKMAWVYGISSSHISNIVNRKVWSWLC